MQPSTTQWQQPAPYLEAFCQLTTEFLRNLPQRPVAAANTQAPDITFKQQGHDFDQVLALLQNQVIPHLSASAGPRYWGFVTGGATPIATFADWLVASFDQNVSKGGDSIATAIEHQAIEWLTELFELPPQFKGVFTTGATSANFLGALTARQFAGEQQGIDVAEQGVFALEIEVFSATPHASMVKGLGFAGLGRKQFKTVATIENSEAMCVKALAQALGQSRAKSKVVIASAATVTATDFDDLQAIARLCQQHQAWLHVDAAFGIFERLLSGPNGKTKGLELADSITLDCHKWLNVPYDCGVFLCQKPQYLFSSCDVPAPYLSSSDGAPDFMSLGIENSRRFRALPVWLSLFAYGKTGIKHWVEKNIAQAGMMAQWLERSEVFELVHYGSLNVVLFRPNTTGLTPAAADSHTEQVLAQVNRDGRVFLSPGSWQGQKVIRMALSNWQTEPEDIAIAQAALLDALNVTQD